MCLLYLQFQVMLRSSEIIKQTCICRCVNTRYQIFASSLSNKKGIFSVFYIAFLQHNRHFTINYNKIKVKRTGKKCIYSYIIIHGFMASKIL